MNNEDWLTNILKDMIKNKSAMVNLGKMKILRNENTLTQFSFEILINKSLFEDVLSDEEKSMLWLEGNYE